MENIFIESTQYTPEISLDAKNGVIDLIGKSYPENTFDFYGPLLKWVHQYIETKISTIDKTSINIELIYFNSSSSKLLFDFFDLFEAASTKHNIVVNWIYAAENENALEAGRDFIDDFDVLKINLVVKDQIEIST